MKNGKVVYHFESQVTGQVVPRFRDVIEAIAYDLIRCHFLNLRWRYSKKGF